MSRIDRASLVAVGKESVCSAGEPSSIPGLGRSPGEGNGLPTPVFGPGEFHGLCSPRGCKESDRTERLTHLITGSLMLCRNQRSTVGGTYR
ncbi:unnamed protein product [Rangifer tarandus platyrhynchus]|uniref:Uncharacterized protein n=2 Tax=Rangifer tarandus platyrhynchus TaxID=3082113 RepID=A0AC59ZFB3_RANTA|nr:unnamed protein product [Rangifer tarandus platyrhynchus]